MAKENKDMRYVIREKDELIESIRAELAEAQKAQAEIIENDKAMQ
jgi:hypothetical protein